MTVLSIPMKMVFKKYWKSEHEFIVGVANDQAFSTSNDEIIHYRNIPKNSNNSINGFFTYHLKDDTETWIQNNNINMTLDTIPYLDDPNFSGSFWYKLVAIFENDHDAILFKMRWL